MGMNRFYFMNLAVMSKYFIPNMDFLNWNFALLCEYWGLTLEAAHHFAALSASRVKERWGCWLEAPIDDDVH